MAVGGCCLKKNQNAPRPSEHLPVRGEKMSKRLLLFCYIFFALTDRASTIPSNIIRGCQCGTRSAGQEKIRGTKLQREHGNKTKHQTKYRNDKKKGTKICNVCVDTVVAESGRNSVNKHQIIQPECKDAEQADAGRNNGRTCLPSPNSQTRRTRRGKKKQTFSVFI